MSSDLLFVTIKSITWWLLCY